LGDFIEVVELFVEILGLLEELSHKHLLPIHSLFLICIPAIKPDKAVITDTTNADIANTSILLLIRLKYFIIN